MIEQLLATDPFFVVTAIVSLVGLSLYYLYGGFIEENHAQIKWFRRLFLPHVTKLLHDIDEQNEDIDLDGLYVETNIHQREHVFDLYLDERVHREGGIEMVSEELIKNHFRPEVILASLGNNPQDKAELGNFVLTAPMNNHPDVPVMGRLYDIFVMLVSKYQLHVRIYYDEDKHRLRFYAHHELNPYNPRYAKKHLQGEEMDIPLGVEMFKKYKEDISQYGVEVTE